jgi:hypothetical protein
MILEVDSALRIIGWGKISKTVLEKEFSTSTAVFP